MEPYEKGSWLVSTEKVRNEALLQLLKVRLKNIENNPEANIHEDISPLSGGYVLEMENGVKIYPECCGSLEDIYEWVNACQTQNTKEEMLWIGHLWLMVKSLDQNTIQLRRENDNIEKPEVFIFMIKRNDLESAIVQTKLELRRFHREILGTLKIMKLKEIEVIADILIHGYTPQKMSL